ncbi:MAG: MerR family transcriptional regulator [Deltaproteobacteria bacterium]|jgi:DNA-binding transcriptional MerR regulator/effector-binding domain-containing protein|nr:MerR family transcriptional regulator [Deltaproteobacteria bacterium]
MHKQQLFSAGKFAKLSRTTLKTLHHYDAIGILPAIRGENNYRYYSTMHLSLVNMIRVLQKLGMTLDKIINLKNTRTPESQCKLYKNQIYEINKKIDGLARAKKLLLTLHEITNSALNVDEAKITIQFLPVEAIMLGNVNDYSRGMNEYNALFEFYCYMQRRYPDIDFNYPVWGVFSEKRIKNCDWRYPDRYYFYNPEGYDKRPANLYAIGYIRGNYGQTDELYHRMIEYIDNNGFEICGDAYEEYPLNELSVSDNTNYLIRVMITVRKK